MTIAQARSALLLVQGQSKVLHDVCSAQLSSEVAARSCGGRSHAGEG